MDFLLFFFKSVVSEFPPQSFNTVPHDLISLSFTLDEQGTSEEDDHDRENATLQEEAGRTPALRGLFEAVSWMKQF